MEDFRKYSDIDRVEYYELDHHKDGTLTLRLYDKNKKLVNAYAKN